MYISCDGGVLLQLVWDIRHSLGGYIVKHGNILGVFEVHLEVHFKAFFYEG